MRESKKSEGGAFKAPLPPDRIGLIICELFLEIIRFYHVDKLIFFYYTDNLKVSTIVSIKFVFLEIVQILCENWL